MKEIERMHEVLEHETALAAELLSAMQGLQKALVEFRADDLLAAVRREQEALRPLEQAERERLAFFGAAFPDSGWEDAATLDRLARSLPPAEGERLRAAGGRLREMAEQIVAVNDRNRILLGHSAAFVRTTLRAVTDGYGRRIIDQRV